jgi:putative FmdB family regulatory protein
VPTYAYACTECDHRFEAVQSFSDDSLTVCPECEGRLRKVFNAVGIVFKGGGFYRTDSRSGSSVTAGSSSNGSASGGAGSSDSGGSSGSAGSGGSSSDGKSASTSGGSSTGNPAKTPSSTASA